MSSNRRADASRRKKGIYTRQELIKKHGLATFHPDPEENRKLQETKGKNRIISIAIPCQTVLHE